jgi:hypothetical protein
MAAAYRYAIEQAAADVMLGLPQRDRWRLRDYFVRLAGEPFADSPQRVPSEGGREYLVVATDRFVITYWVDHAVARVCIMAIERA